ncbi:MAG: T9SS type A sorting domain-containing protein [Ignavibacteria bacterium]|nr:T9SS type A sorting domain-containing protein [Ignavibacteria bacterium]
MASQDRYTSFHSNVYRTSNGGNNWVIVYENTSAACYDMWFFNSTTGIISEQFAGVLYGPGAIYKTVNGFNFDQIWTQQYFTISGFYFINELTGWCSNGSKIKKTMDGGYNWTDYSIPSNYVAKIFFLNANYGFYMATSGEIFRSTNGGVNWTLISSAYLVDKDLWFTDSLNGFKSGLNSYGSIFRTSNGGYDWCPVLNSESFVKKIQFLNYRTGYALENIKRIYRTSDCGFTWVQQDLDTMCFYYSFSFADEYTGYIAGTKGVVMKTTNGGSTYIHTNIEVIPQRFFLNQNYPNPFNPTTKIKFAVPKSSFVNIKVFDIMGKEIETLVNENLQAGTYDTQWDASKYSSGVYYYQLSINDKRLAVKKMVLVK